MRTRDFEKQEVMTKVLGVFWRKGYVATSIDDLTCETGIARSGLYGEFKSKKGLFLEATRLYEKVVVDSVIGEIEKTDLGLEGIRRVFEKVLTTTAADERLGCLICNASSELAAADDEVATVVLAFHKRVRAAFLHCLKNAQRLEQLSKKADVGALADFLLVSFQGLAHAIRSPMPTRTVKNFVEATLTMIEAK